MAIGMTAPRPALAQVHMGDDQPADFDFFYGQLTPYGNWFETERWGYVWQPADIGSDFRPYYDGHWIYTARYGWYWASDSDWGDIVYHYGRWVFDPEDGWLWVPGYVWGPAWVIWREGDGVTGWFPMPPDDAFFDGDEPFVSDWGDYADDDYGYRDWYGPDFSPTFFSLWIYVDNDHFGERRFHRYVRRDRDDHDFFRRTHDDTRYARVHGYVVNRGVDPDRLPRPVHPVSLDQMFHDRVLRPAPIGLGQKIGRREWQRHPQLMPQWVRHKPAQSEMQGRQEPGPQRNWPSVSRQLWPSTADHGQNVPSWRHQHNGRFAAPDAPGEAPPYDRVMPGQETAPPVVEHARRQAPHEAAPEPWQGFERSREPEPPSRTAVPAQNFQRFQQRSPFRPAYAAAPENRSVPERSSPQRPVKAPQQREEQPRDRGRRELPR
ncbi:MAG: hypothetical protein KGJ81_16005 [Alphaproteobacteria bacterium]|nr:hypothetical protein [Alphaproteobacteria bacterium]